MEENIFEMQTANYWVEEFAYALENGAGADVLDQIIEDAAMYVQSHADYCEFYSEITEMMQEGANA